MSLSKKLKAFQPPAKRSNFTEHCMNSHMATKSHNTFPPDGQLYKFALLKGDWEQV